MKWFDFRIPGVKTIVYRVRQTAVMALGALLSSSVVRPSPPLPKLCVRAAAS
jgi:hypothetical protein